MSRRLLLHRFRKKEVAAAEAKTRWEQLRLNAARQRESFLEAIDGQVKTFRVRAQSLRGEGGGNQPGRRGDRPQVAAASIASLRKKLEEAEAELLRESARRRELEADLARRAEGGRR